jgi:hypothetical protein
VAGIGGVGFCLLPHVPGSKNLGEADLRPDREWMGLALGLVERASSLERRYRRCAAEVKAGAVTVLTPSSLHHSPARKVLKSVRRQLGVDRSVLDVAVPEVCLQGPGIDASVGELVPGTMT